MMNTGGGKVSTGHDHGSMTNQGQDMPDNPREEIIGKSDIKKINVNMDFIMQLNNVYDSYIELKNALVASDANKSKQAASKIQQTLSKIDMSLLKGDAHNQWMGMLDTLNLHLKTISSSGAIESQRTSFAGLSDALYVAVKTFGLMGKTAYYQFCPMAKDGKGAYWLSEVKDIQNPYFGKEMIDCGENKETLNY